MREKLFAFCSPGLEPFVAQELQQLGLGSLDGSLHDVYRANLLLRTADRVLVRLGEFYANTFHELRRKAGRLPWERYLTPGGPVAFRVACEKSRLYHEGAVAQRLAEAIADRLGKAPSVQKKCGEGPGIPQLIVVRLTDDLCAIRVDSSGEPLHKRGYRLATAKAPLKETLACAMVKAAGWDESSPLLDPFCGSGTIAIEAALSARRIPPGHARRFAFMDWPGFDGKPWEKLLADARGQILPCRPRILASDRDAGAVKAARANAERAGVARDIEFSCRAVSAIEPPACPGWVVTNPPYGVRLEGKDDLRNLYAQFGKVLRAKCPGWRAAVLCGGSHLIRSTGLEFEQGLSTMNGGLSVKLSNCRI